jgi:aubergine
MMKTNYFDLERNVNFVLGQYRFDFEPDTEVVNTRKAIVKENIEQLKLTRFTFDGSSLYTASEIPTGTIETTYKGNPMKITVRQTGTIRADDKNAFQIFNLIFRDTMATLKLQNIRRNYYDPHAAIDVPEGNLQLWPGYLTSIRAYEHERTLLNVEVIHKFMRNETIYDIAKRFANDTRLREDWREALKREVIGSTVLTDYTNKTYLIDDLDFTMSPRSTFRSSNGQEMTYAAYYTNKYQITIQDEKQFLLVSRARERDIRAGHPELIYLIPELSRATGLTDTMRANFRLMQNISSYTRLTPTARADSLHRFNNRLRQTPEATRVLNQWNMKLGLDLVDVKARELPPERIIFGEQRMETPSARAEWNIRDGVKMYSAIECNRWVFFYPREMERESLNFLKALREAGTRMNYEIAEPLHRAIYDDRQVRNFFLQH